MQYAQLICEWLVRIFYEAQDTGCSCDRLPQPLRSLLDVAAALVRLSVVGGDHPSMLIHHRLEMSQAGAKSPYLPLGTSAAGV
jgi:hypothetical protein